MPPLIIFCAFTRLEYMDRWFDDLASTDIDPENTSLAFIIDIGEEVGHQIYARIMDEMNKTKFKKFVIARNYEHHVNEVNIPVRRKRIAEVKNQSREMVSALDGEYVLGLEDDTVFTNLSVQRLFEKAQYDQVGFVTAYEAGRWHNKIIGVWNFDDVSEPTECWTLLPGQDFEEIDAAGFYCYLTTKELYVEHEYNSEQWQPWGPDVNFGLWCRKMGFTNFVDWSQPCGHNDSGVIITPNSDLYSEHFIKTDRGLDFPTWERRKQ